MSTLGDTDRLLYSQRDASWKPVVNGLYHRSEELLRGLIIVVQSSTDVQCRVVQIVLGLECVHHCLKPMPVDTMPGLGVHVILLASPLGFRPRGIALLAFLRGIWYVSCLPVRNALQTTTGDDGSPE